MSKCVHCEEIMEGDAPGTCEDCVNGDTVILRGPIGEVRRTISKKDLKEELRLAWIEADKLCTALLDMPTLYKIAHDLRGAIADHMDIHDGWNQ